jgi:serine protease
VEYAVPDRIKTIRALPNDPLFNHQWYLQAPSATQPAATDALGAWNLTGGKSGVVVAVVDTGVRFDHEDLRAKLLPGYDFVSTISTPAMARRPRCRRQRPRRLPLDSRPRQPDLAHHVRQHLDHPQQLLARHPGGRHRCGRGQQPVGIAGIGGATRILPVRVLGKCGGFDSTSSPACAGPPGWRCPACPPTPTRPGSST